MESASYVLSFRMVLFYLVTTGWIFDISLLCENSINQINYQSIKGFIPKKQNIHKDQIDGTNHKADDQRRNVNILEIR